MRDIARHVGSGRSLLLAAAVGLGPGWGPLASAQTVVLRADDPAVVASGAALYTAHCAACHGSRLEGQPEWRQRRTDGRLPAPPHDASGHTWHHADALLFRLTKHGPGAVAGADYKTDMPAYEGVLSDEEIVAVLSFIKSQWPADIQTHQGAMGR